MGPGGKPHEQALGVHRLQTGETHDFVIQINPVVDQGTGPFQVRLRSLSHRRPQTRTIRQFQDGHLLSDPLAERLADG